MSGRFVSWWRAEALVDTLPRRRGGRGVARRTDTGSAVYRRARGRAAHPRTRGLRHTPLTGYGLRRASVARKAAAPWFFAGSRAPWRVVRFALTSCSARRVAARRWWWRRSCSHPACCRAEQVPGLVNRRLARFADGLLGYEGSRAGPGEDEGAGRATHSPHADLPAGGGVRSARRRTKTVLVIGGSRGAHAQHGGAGAAAALASRRGPVRPRGAADRAEVERRVAGACAGAC
jgi:hypothetical protein